MRPVGAEETLGVVRALLGGWARALPHTDLVTAVTSFPTDESFSRTHCRPCRGYGGETSLPGAQRGAQAPSGENRVSEHSSSSLVLPDSL